MIQLYYLLNIVSKFPQLKIKETDGFMDHSRGCCHQILPMRMLDKYLENIYYNYVEI